MIRKGTPITELEYAVLGRLVRGEDPWGGAARGAPSRRISGALGRLQRRGYANCGPISGNGAFGWYVTDAGKQMWGSL